VFGLQHLGLSALPFSLAVEFLQLLSILGLINAQWPSWLSGRVFPVASLATGNLDVGAVGCTALSSWGRWALGLLLPVGTASLLVLVHAVAGLWVEVRRCTRRRRAMAPSTSAALTVLSKLPLKVDPLPLGFSPLNAALAVLAVTYLFAVRVALEPLRCVELNGEWVVATDTSLPCGLWSGGVRGKVAAGVAVLYGVCVPVLFLRLLLVRSVGVRVDQAAHIQGRGVSTPSNNPYHLLRRGLWSLYEAATPDAYLWVVVVLARKAALVTAVSLLHHTPEASMHVAIGVLLLALGATGSLQPYRTLRTSVSKAKCMGAWCVAPFLVSICMCEPHGRGVPLGSRRRMLALVCVRALLPPPSQVELVWQPEHPRDCVPGGVCLAAAARATPASLLHCGRLCGR
jgi:hypothetical protein